MLKSFAEYLKEEKEPVLEEIEDLTEAVVPEMKKFFKTNEIQDIGKKLASIGISMQSSEIQAWGPLGFRLKHAKEHKVHIVKVKNARGYVMLYYVNARSADIVQNTTGIEFANSKEVYQKAEQVFSFNSTVDVSRLRELRWENRVAATAEDPLNVNRKLRGQRLQDLKAKKANKGKADAIVKKLLTNYGIKLTGLRVEEGSFVIDAMNVANLSRYITKEIIQTGLRDRPTLKLTVKSKGYTGAHEIRALISELQDALEAAEALDNLDPKQLA